MNQFCKKTEKYVNFNMYEFILFHFTVITLSYNRFQYFFEEKIYFLFESFLF